VSSQNVRQSYSEPTGIFRRQESQKGARSNVDPLQGKLDDRLRRIHDAARLLPALTNDDAAVERARLVAELERGRAPVPRFTVRPRPVPRYVWNSLAEAQVFAAQSVAPRLYEARLEELELDLLLLECLGEPRRVRPLAARRFGTGRETVETSRGSETLSALATQILETVEPNPEPRLLEPAAAPGVASLETVIRGVALHAGLEVEVRVEPRLAAGAATGDRVVLVASRRFGEREACRLAVHEVLGHLVAAHNGRAQPLLVLELGTAGSFIDQEGLALCLEDASGLMDACRLRTIAARVVVTDRLHSGATFPDTARMLVRDLSFSPSEAIVLCERAWRGGGVARDACYLRGFVRVRRALAHGLASIDDLRAGRIGLDDLAELRALARDGFYVPPAVRPSLPRSFRLTASGTRPLTSPPSFAASLTMFELT
jgi:uncharacterized protein (TIGR02421 family)